MEERICLWCKYWERSDGEKYMGSCDCDKFVYGNKPEIDGFRYWDYEDYFAGFDTGERFGCIHWVRKEK